MTLTTIRRIVVFTFVVLSIVDVSLATNLPPAFKTTIRKCCPADQMLDDRYICVKVPDNLSANETSGYVRKVFWNEFCLNNKCSDLRFKTVGFKGCPAKQRIESNYLEAFPNGSLVSGNGPSGERTLVRQPTGCGDLTLPANLNDPPEGPVYIYCMGSGEGGPAVSGGLHHDQGFVTKCCPRDQILDTVEKKCVDVSSLGITSVQQHWPLPVRKVRDPVTGLATSIYRFTFFVYSI